MRTMKIMVIDELNDVFCAEEYKIPFNDGELTNVELEAMYELYVSRMWIAPEYMGVYMSTDYRTKETVEEEEEAFNAEIAAIMEACDCDEEEAYEILQFERTRSWIL